MAVTWKKVAYESDVLLKNGTVALTGAWAPGQEVTFTNSGLHILDTNASHDLVVKPGSDLTADRILTVTTGDAARTLTLSGDLNVESSSNVNQDLTTDASPQFTALNVGHATDTTITRTGAGDIAVEGNAVYRAGGTDVAVADGGTNLSSYTAGDLIYASGATTLAKLAKGTALQSLKMNSGATAPSWVTDRELLTAARTYYIRTDGHDTASGLNNTSDATTGAWLTLQHAYDVIAGTLDLGGKDVTIQMGDGTYTSGLEMLSPWTGGGNIYIIGNTGNRDSVYFNTSASMKFLHITCSMPGSLFIQYLKLNCGTYSAFSHWGVGWVNVKEINFASGGNALMVATPGAVIDLYGTSVISGNYACFAMSISPGSYVYLDAYWEGSYTITLSGTPAFSSAFAIASTLGHVYVSGSGITFSGSGTGKRYNVIENSIIATEGSGATYLPGNASGTTATGGLYT